MKIGFTFQSFQIDLKIEMIKKLFLFITLVVSVVSLLPTFED